MVYVVLALRAKNCREQPCLKSRFEMNKFKWLTKSHVPVSMGDVILEMYN